MTDLQRPLVGALATHDDLVNAVNWIIERLNTLDDEVKKLKDKK